MRRDTAQVLLAGRDKSLYDTLSSLIADIENGDQFDLRYVSSLRDALVEINRERYDVCLIDEELGVSRLPELAQAARRRGYDLPLILLAGEGASRAVSEALPGGAADFLIKEQLTASTLAQALRYARNLAEHKRVEEALRESRHRYESLVNSIDGIVWECDPETFQFLFVSPQAERLLGYPVAQWLSEADFWQAHIHPDDAEWCLRLCRKAVAERRTHRFEYRMIAADGRVVWLSDLVTVIVEDDRPVLLRGVMFDITERRRADEAVARSEEQLLQSQKLEAIGRLAGGVAHDFNNLLTAITGYSDLSLRRLAEGDPVRRHIEEIKKAAARAAGLTRQLLAFSRKQVLQLKVFDLNAVVAEMEKMLRRLIGEDVVLAVDLSPSPCNVKADPGQIEQVVMNLAVNARDAMPGGGTLFIKTQNVQLGDADADENAGAPPGQYVLISISDTGHGMDAETRRHIFEPFFTTKEKGKGTGLGLSTVYGIVTQSGGHLQVSSEPGLGTTFNVYLPVAAEETETVKLSPAELELPRGSETILLVEDDPGVREMTREILRMCGYRVLVAGRGGEAVRICEEYEGEIELLLTDVVMPHLSGKELADALKFLRPRMLVLFMSGYTDDAIVRHGVLDEEVAFLQKPFTPSSLARKLREVLEARPETVPK